MPLFLLCTYGVCECVSVLMECNSIQKHVYSMYVFCFLFFFLFYSCSPVPVNGPAVQCIVCHRGGEIRNDMNCELEIVILD